MKNFKENKLKNFSELNGGALPKIINTSQVKGWFDGIRGNEVIMPEIIIKIIASKSKNTNRNILA